jgi:transposase-like protein
MRPKSAIDVVCPNPMCKYYSKEEGKHIIKKGKNKGNHQQYLCLHCNNMFLDTTNGFLFNRHLSEAEIIEIINLLSKGNAIRTISRVTGHDRGVLSKLLVVFAFYAEDIDAFIFNRLKMTRADIIVFWNTVLHCRRHFRIGTKSGLTKILEKHYIRSDIPQSYVIDTSSSKTSNHKNPD